MAQDLGGNMDDELDRLNLIHSVGLQMTSDFIPAFRSDFPVIVPDEEIKKMGLPQTNGANLTDTSYLAGVDTRLVGGFDPHQSFAFGGGEGIGSNDFVISGDLTTTGMPLLANDPHLGIQMPSIWYEIGLHCVNAAGEVARSEACPFELRGFSFAGVPGIILGHNDRIAWGFTNVNPDVQDLVVERINPDNPNQYEVNGEWVDMDIRREEIKVSGQDEPNVILARSTRHGPVMTDRGSMGQYANFEVTDQPLPDNYSLTVMALRWTALQPTRSYEAIWHLNQASNWDEFRDALTYFDVPSQNVVYADVDGNIGYQIPVSFPSAPMVMARFPFPAGMTIMNGRGSFPSTIFREPSTPIRATLRQPISLSSAMSIPTSFPVNSITAIVQSVSTR